MNRVKLFIALSFLLLLSCEKQPVIVKEVFCYDCYRHTIEVGQEITQIGGFIISTDTVQDKREFVMTVCLTPEDMGQINLYEGESSITVLSFLTSPPISLTGTLYRLQKIETIECE